MSRNDLSIHAADQIIDSDLIYDYTARLIALPMKTPSRVYWAY